MIARFARTLSRALLMAALFAAPVPARAQVAETPAAQTPASPPAVQPAPAPVAPSNDGTAEAPRVRTSDLIDQARSRLDQVTAGLRRDSLDDSALASLKDALSPASDQLRQAISILGPRLVDAKERLDKLGPKPDAKAPPESAEVVKDREAVSYTHLRAHET